MSYCFLPPVSCLLPVALPLTLWAIMRIPAAQPQVRDWRAAAWAGLPSALENVPAMLRATRPTKQIRLRSTQHQPFFDHLADRIVQSLNLGAIK